MAARPPPQGATEEPDAITFGIAALDPYLDGVEFPVTAERLIDDLGDPVIPYDASGSSVRLSEAIEEANRNRFESRRDLQNALYPVFDRLRSRGGAGLFGTLRSLLPF
ncbi:hypothetical protein [Natronomonas sp. EA1]|uniref:DUF5789 family protein n=1 Tax=Natronomonas sp. EA1 TaxID=3421655 RepID=UPI003EB7DCE9